MASATLDLSAFYAPGTNVGAYRRSQWPQSSGPASGVPEGVAAASAIVSATGRAAFSGLADDGTRYLVYAGGLIGPRFMAREVDPGDGGAPTFVQLGSISGATVIDVANRGAVDFGATLAGASAISFSRFPAGARVRLTVAQEAAGGRVGTFTGVTWITNSPPQLWPGANAITSFEFFSLDGVTILGVAVSTPSDRAQGMPYSHPDVVETMPLLLADSARGMGSGSMVITHFTPDSDAAITLLASLCNGTLAATPTLSKMGLYEYQGAGNYICRGRSAHDAALWTGAQGVFEKAIADDGTGVAGSTPAAGYTLRAGVEYGLAVLFVGVTAPQLAGRAPTSGAGGAGSPLTYRGKRMSAVVNGQVDIPATLAAQNTLTSAVLWGGCR